MSKMRIGIIGSGGTGTRHADRFSEIEAADVVAIASRNAETGNALAEKHGAEFIPDWEALVQRDNLDGVVICTHNDTHAEITLAALRYDKHIFMEYPLARSINAGEVVVEVAQSNQRVLRINHSETVSNSHRAIKQKVQELGDLLLTTFLRLTPGRGTRQRFCSICPFPVRRRTFLSTISTRLSISSEVSDLSKVLRSTKA